MRLCREVSSKGLQKRTKWSRDDVWILKSVCGKPCPLWMRPQNCTPAPPAYVYATGVKSRKTDCSTSGWLSTACWSPIHQPTVRAEVLVPTAQLVPSLEGELKHQRNEQRVLLLWRCLASSTTILFSDFTLSACTPKRSKIRNTKNHTETNMK